MHSFVNIMNSRYSYSTRSIKNNHFYLWNDDYLCLRYAWNNLNKCSHRFRIRRDCSRMKRLTLGIEKYNLNKCSHRFRIRRDSSRMKRLTLGIEKHNLMNDWNRTMFLCFNFADFWVWSVVLCFFQLHKLSCLRITAYSLYLDNFGICQKCEN